MVRELMVVFTVMTLCILTTGCGMPRDGKDGRDGVAGASGRDGADGVNGVNGKDGKDGARGLQGPPGADGTEVRVVKFCEGDVADYPSTFPEYGLCINDSLFAVYSEKGGFLALIPPGRYSSNAIGSKCDFTVQAHCKVTR